MKIFDEYFLKQIDRNLSFFDKSIQAILQNYIELATKGNKGAFELLGTSEINT